MEYYTALISCDDKVVSYVNVKPIAKRYATVLTYLLW